MTFVTRASPACELLSRLSQDFVLRDQGSRSAGALIFLYDASRLHLTGEDAALKDAELKAMVECSL